MATPTISILMATRNRANLIGQAIESVRRQTLREWELIVIDDGSPDNTAEVMVEWERRDGRIKYLRIPRIGHIAGVSNAGLRAANGEFVAILDDDDYWIDDRKLERQVAFLHGHPDHVACGGWFISVDGDGKETARFRKPETDAAIRRVALFANPIANSTALFRRTEGGYYDEAVHGFADWDFWLTLGKRGKLANLPEYFLAYRMWSGSGSFVDTKRNADAGLRIVLKHRGEYPGFYRALAMAEIYRIYARLPLGVRRWTNKSLSRLKKWLFSR
ncbi:MAG TPA: glycosyltransferase family 2 protein [Candidatus Paceibacterota bacterium]|nr:glycosyltransferase family 2 protein [Candidatus Paceibacterota bacterium]